MSERPPELDRLFDRDGYLRSYEHEIVRRYNAYKQMKSKIDEVGQLPYFNGIGCSAEAKILLLADTRSLV